MPQIIIPAIIVTLIIAIVVYNYYFSRIAKIKRKLKQASYSKIKNVRNGDISKIVGIVESIDEPLIAPLTKRKCCYYYIKVEKQVSSGKSSHWSTIIEDVKSSKFVILDEDSRAYISSKNIQSYIVFDAKFNSGTFNDPSENLDNYLAQHGEESFNVLGFNKTIRYREAVLEVGEKIAALGEGKWQDAMLPDLPEHLGQVLYLNPTKEMPIFLSDCVDTTEKITIAKSQKKELRKRYRK